jgi:hypothetical protein
MLLPLMSVRTSPAKDVTYSRHTRAAGASNPDGPGVSNNRRKKASESSRIT